VAGETPPPIGPVRLSPAGSDGLTDALLGVHAEAQRYIAARAALGATETGLIRAVASALAAGATADELCARLTGLDLDPDELPRSLQVALGCRSGS
jgi:hypothetical protein